LKPNCYDNCKLRGKRACVRHDLSLSYVDWRPPCEKKTQNVKIRAYDKHNEAGEVQFLRRETPRKPHGLSTFLSDSLYLRTHSSTPCDIFANSREATLLSRYCITSSGKVTVIYGFLFAIRNKILQKLINNYLRLYGTIRRCLMGVSNYDRKHTGSERAVISHNRRRFSDDRITNSGRTRIDDNGKNDAGNVTSCLGSIGLRDQKGICSILRKCGTALLIQAVV